MEKYLSGSNRMVVGAALSLGFLFGMFAKDVLFSKGEGDIGRYRPFRAASGSLCSFDTTSGRCYILKQGLKNWQEIDPYGEAQTSGLKRPKFTAAR